MNAQQKQAYQNAHQRDCAIMSESTRARADWMRMHRAEEAHREECIALARAEYGSDEIEIDGGALTSEGDDNGCFVQAWVWVSFAGTKLDKDAE